MKQTFDINEIENLLADQQDVKGMLNLLDDTLLKIKQPLNGYDNHDFGDVPNKLVKEVAYEMQRDSDALSAIIRFLQDMNVKTSKTISNEVECYYHDARNQ